MPIKREKPISDDLLTSNEVWKRDPYTPLSARQVSIMTDLSVGQLRERRRTRPPKPPLTFHPEEEDGTQRAVWYPLGEVLAYKQGRLTRPLPPLVRDGQEIANFTAFMTHALPGDEWPFATTREGLPVDFFASIGMGELIDAEGECGWLTLSEYLEELSLWTTDRRVDAERRGLTEAMKPSEGTGAACPKCGQLLGSEHRNCRV
jgi:hypothetical protein